jgi:hypothetical protein
MTCLARRTDRRACHDLPRHKASRNRETRRATVNGMGIFEILLVGDGHDDGLAQEFELHADREPVKLRFHRSGRAPLDKIAQTAITVR